MLRPWLVLLVLTVYVLHQDICLGRLHPFRGHALQGFLFHKQTIRVVL